MALEDVVYPDLTELIPLSQLDSAIGGDYQYEFDHDIYSMILEPDCGVHHFLLTLTFYVHRACKIVFDGTRVDREC
jgi:hypothetical protein